MRERESRREEMHAGANPSSPGLGRGLERAGKIRAGLGFGCAIIVRI